MNHIELWALLNCICRLIVMLICAYRVHRYNHMLNLGQRLGLGIAGGSSLMTIAPIWDIEKHGTPFDNWSPFLLAFGFGLYMISAMVRDRRHDHANIEQVRRSREYLTGRGLL